jgi:hypothetical protein
MTTLTAEVTGPAAAMVLGVLNTPFNVKFYGYTL